ncbi:MAG: response regulator [Bacteroidales bacterium]
MLNIPRKTILLADDDPDYLFQIKLLLEKNGYQVITADSQREAEKILEKIKPDLAILDLMMENEDSGFILSYKIKKVYPSVPVIIATAVTAETGISFEAASESDLRWIKADLFLPKGLRPDQFLREIAEILKK